MVKDTDFASRNVTHQESLRRIHAYANEIRAKLRGAIVYGVPVNEHDDPDVELVAAYCMALLDGGISSEVHIGGHKIAGNQGQVSPKSG
jgi:hypothetical protein